MKRHLLVVEDEKKLNSLICEYLRQEGYQVSTAFNLKEANNLLKYLTDLIILDLMLPDGNGLDFCKEIKKQKDIPVIILTAKNDEFDKVLGLELGADDYITKPFSFRELAARIKAVLRRYKTPVENEEIINHGRVTVDLNKHLVFVEDKKIILTPTEFKILSHLMQKPGRVYTRLQLLEAIGEDYEGYERSLDTHISNLRKKVEKNPNKPEFIVTVYGIGYKVEENLGENT
jgi:two-component system OmpR family response regulator